MVELIVAFPKAENAKAIKNILVKNGYNVIATALTGADAIYKARALDNAIVVCAYSFPDMIYTDIRNSLDETSSLLLITSPERLEEPVGEDVVFLPLPLKVYALIDSVEMIIADILKRKKKKKSGFKKTVEELSIISKAKNILMERHKMSEERAHRYLQKTSMNKAQSLVDTALMIISLND